MKRSHLVTLVIILLIITVLLFIFRVKRSIEDHPDQPNVEGVSPEIDSSSGSAMPVEPPATVTDSNDKKKKNTSETSPDETNFPEKRKPK